MHQLLERIASVRALTIQFWFWIANLPPFLMAYLFMSDAAFTRFTLLYLGVVTILTAALGALSSLVAEEVRVHQDKDANVQEVLDKLEE